MEIKNLHYNTSKWHQATFQIGRWAIRIGKAMLPDSYNTWWDYYSKNGRIYFKKPSPISHNFFIRIWRFAAGINWRMDKVDRFHTERTMMNGENLK